MSTASRTVFLSHAPAAIDVDAARRIAEALRAAGVAVVFEANEIHGGDLWDRRVRQQIRECTLFMPLVSAQTQAQHEGYFRLEWHLAEQRSQLIARGRAFIVPVCIDATSEAEALVPEAFFTVPWLRPAPAESLAHFVAHVQRLLAQPLSPSRQSNSGGGSRKPFAPDSPSIPDYELIRQIGRGSYGDVWLARGVTGIYRAVKLVWRERFSDPEPFEREFKGLTEFAAVSLGESIQLALLHVGRNDALGFFYYVMELADDAERGRTIDPERYVPLTFTELRKRRGRVPAGDCLTYATELARVLAGLHARRLVHRDIKPSNVILVNGVPKLADIGLVAPAASARTFVGTDGFVPPEGPGSPGADVFALGKVLYELSTGLDRQDFPQLPSGLTRLGDHEALLDLNEIILRACDPAPDKRYRDGAALLADLQALRAGRPVVKKSRWPIALAGAAAAALGTAGFFALPRKSAPPAPAPKSAAVSPAEAAAAPPPARHTEPAARALVPADTDKSLVVLPLKNLSPQSADASFTEGVHEELIAVLARLLDVKVLARPSALRAESSGIKLPQFRERLGVAHVVRGSVRRDDNALRLELEFCRTSDGERVWAKNYDTSPQDLPAVLTHVAQELVRALGARTVDPNFANSRFFTRDAAAFDALLKARRAADGSSDVARSEAAITLAEQAIRHDANYGAAALQLATSYIAAYRAERDQATKPRFVAPAKRWAETAARVLPAGGADAALANYYLYVEPDTARSVRFAESAARAFPNNSDHHYLFGIACFRSGRLADAAHAHRRSVALDPLNAGKRQLELHALARLRRGDEWERATKDYRAAIGANQPADVHAEQSYALTSAFPADTRQMSYTVRLEWLWRERKFAELSILAASELPKLNFMGEICGLKMRWGDALQRLGRTEEANVLFVETLRLARDIATRPLIDPSANDIRMGQTLARRGLGEEAIAVARRGVDAMLVERQLSERWDREIELDKLYALLGRTRECVALVGELLRLPSGLTMPMLRVSPDWDNVREDLTFKALLADPKNSAPL